MQFGQGITNLTLGLANHQAMPDVVETVGDQIAGKGGVVAVKIGSLVLDILTPDGSEITNEQGVKILLKAISSGATFEDLNELAEELGLEIKPHFADYHNNEAIEPSRNHLEELHKKFGMEEPYE